MEDKVQGNLLKHLHMVAHVQRQSPSSLLLFLRYGASVSDSHRLFSMAYLLSHSATGVLGGLIRLVLDSMQAWVKRNGSCLLPKRHR